jgi:hypothetical protein
MRVEEGANRRDFIRALGMDADMPADEHENHRYIQNSKHFEDLKF